MSGFDLDGFLPYRLAVAARRVSHAFAAEYRERFGLDRAEWRVLALLDRRAPISVRDVAEEADMEKSRVSRAVARLEASGRIAKRVSAADRRLVELTLTPEGRALMAELTPLAQDYQRRLDAELGDAAEGLRAALDRLAARPPADD